MPAVSVLMPCYQAAFTLEEALASLAQQTLEDFEVIAVDDGSTDGTLELLEQWARREPRLQIIAQPHRGIVQALNAGLAACRSELVARMDADDRALPERLRRQTAYLADHPEATVVGCRVAAFPEGQVREGMRLYLEWQNSLLEDDAIRGEMFVESPLAHPSVLFRRDRVLKAGGYQEHGWAEDYDLWLRLYLAGARFGKVDAVLLEWRELPGRLTRTDSRYSLENFLRLKAHYLMQGPLAGREAVFIWGAGMMGRRLGKQLRRLAAPLQAFVDIDPRKIGRTRGGLPVLAPDQLLSCWERTTHPILLAAVGARGARPLIRSALQNLELVEGRDWVLTA